MEKNAVGTSAGAPLAHVGRNSQNSTAVVPWYLEETYWWAYLHPRGVQLFERQWLISLILWGNYVKLRDCALESLPCNFDGRVLQVACVYGNLTERLIDHLGPETQIDVVDVAPIQLANLRKKIRDHRNVALHLHDSTRLPFEDGTYDYVVVFFLLHEQPEEARELTVRNAFRVVKPGGKVVFVDYHRPRWTNPMRYLFRPVLELLEPFATGLWRREIIDWLPEAERPRQVEKRTYFGGLYQRVVATR